MDWKEILRLNFTSWSKLINYLELDDVLETKILKKSHFPLKLPKRLADKIEKGNFKDPILIQFLPHTDEQNDQEGFLNDPVGDYPAQVTNNLLQKYAQRSLIVTTGACAMHCRYCFRQNYPYESEDKTFEKEISIIEKDVTIEELILSGGDPLSLSNTVLEKLFNRLKDIKHLKRLRIHSRFPIGIPERIDDAFITLLKNAPWQIFFVIHVNHINEMDEEVFLALQKVQQLGIPILNQAVLLKGINDSEESLFSLFKGLADRGILAYYLHQLDQVKGALRFKVEKEFGLQLIKHLETTLPGYAVPKYVQTVPGARGKVHLR